MPKNFLTSKFIGCWNYTVVLTFLSLIITMIGMTQCLHGHYKTAILCLMLSGLCDAFDGRIARTRKTSTKDERAFGVQLDSLCDAVCFGVFPAMIWYMLGVRGVIGLVCICFFVLCGIIRLGYFNVLEQNRQDAGGTGSNKSYHGLPITSSSVIFPMVFWLHFLIPWPIVFFVLMHLTLLVVGFLFVYDFKMPKPSLKVLILIMVVMAAMIGFIFADTRFRIPPANVVDNPLVKEAYTDLDNSGFGPSSLVEIVEEDAQKADNAIKKGK